MSSTVHNTGIQVWDPNVRYGHWPLVAAFAIAYLSADEESGDPDLLHVWSGYAFGVVVAVRVLWGLVGTRYARFRDCACSPASAWQYLPDLARGSARRYVGHSPAAAVLIAALSICLANTVGPALVAYGARNGALANAGAVITTQA